MTHPHISAAALERRAYWITEIVQISGTFGQDSQRVERELEAEISANGPQALMDHLRLAGAIPESYGHDTSEEKLYSKYTDALLAVAFRHVGLKALVLTERADSADVEAVAPDYSLVADAKAFRLSRTAKNQKDFKVQAMDGWKRGKPYAVVVAPLYQLPRSSSQIYEQAATRNVCVLSYSHLCVLVRAAEALDQAFATELFGKVLRKVETLHPSKSAVDYWTAVNGVMVGAGDEVRALWREEKVASLEAITAAREEALTHLASEREAIMRLTHDEALARLISVRKIDQREKVITAIDENGLMSVGEQPLP